MRNKLNFLRAFAFILSPFYIVAIGLVIFLAAFAWHSAGTRNATSAPARRAPPMFRSAGAS